VILAVVVGLLLAHTLVNAHFLRRRSAPRRRTVPRRHSKPSAPSTLSAPSTSDVAVLLPVRDEAARVAPCVSSLLAQDGVRVLVLDDGSTDGTGELVRALGAPVTTGKPLPPGWLGKPHACQQLADAVPDADILVFVDADVVLAPDAVAAAVDLLGDADLLTPYPRIVTGTVGERLVQPLLQWSWLTFLPLRAMERSPRESLAAAGGQFLVVRRTAYERAGGHAAVRDKVLEDIELARAIKRSGGRIALADGSALASCRMYTSWSSLVDGYGKSLWASFGSPVGAGLVVAVLLVLYVAPLFLFSWFGLAAYLLGVLGRVVSARATGGRAFPDALAHPISIVLFGWLVARSYARRGTAAWKGRPVEVSPWRG
jgi:glycosyltransferase involved in cell wall biosynthesis